MAQASKTTSATSLNSPVRHPELYFEDGNLVIQVAIIFHREGRSLTVKQVEDTLFNVHRSILIRHSVVFSDIFALPKPVPGTSVEGSSDEFPLQFPGISSVDFERFLWILYPPLVGRSFVRWSSTYLTGAEYLASTNHERSMNGLRFFTWLLAGNLSRFASLPSANSRSSASMQLTR